jgi:hypothetical protein
MCIVCLTHAATYFSGWGDGLDLGDDIGHQNYSFQSGPRVKICAEVIAGVAASSGTYSNVDYMDCAKGHKAVLGVLRQNSKS